MAPQLRYSCPPALEIRSALSGERSALSRTFEAATARHRMPQGYGGPRSAVLARLVAPQIRAGKRVLIAAHGNSLRALVKYLEDVSEQEILDLNIPTGVPRVEELTRTLKATGHSYLGDAALIEQAVNKAASTGATKR